MTKVVDASVLVASVVDLDFEGRWAQAELNERPLATTEHVLAEATNALRRLELAGDITSAVAAFAFRDLMGLSLAFHPFAPYAARVWELRANLTSYDAWYVAVGESLNCSLVTLDRRLSRASGPTCEIITLPPGR